MIKAVLFDLDGTLLDSAPDLVATLNQLRSQLGLAALPVDELRHFVSHGALGLIKAGMPPCDEETYEQWREAFLRHYADNSFVESRPFEGVEAVLEKLESSGIPWGIVTNKMEYLTLPILEKLGWLASATVIICGDTVANNKPHPEPVLTACESIGVDPCQALMVGDDQRDIESGLKAGCKTALVTYGYAAGETSTEIVDKTVLINSPDEILGLMDVAGPVC